MDPGIFKQWIANFRDIATAGIGIYMLYHETQLLVPNYLIIGAGLSLVGVPAALKLDGIRKGKTDDEAKS